MTKIPIDRDVRKTMGTIVNYKRLKNHLNHPSMINIKQATAYSFIEWNISFKWFNFNARCIGTNAQHTKDLAWKIKTSTNALPTLDFLNRNFLNLLKNYTTCFMCNVADETNNHFGIALPSFH